MAVDQTLLLVRAQIQLVVLDQALLQASSSVSSSGPGSNAASSWSSGSVNDIVPNIVSSSSLDLVSGIGSNDASSLSTNSVSGLKFDLSSSSRFDYDANSGSSSRCTSSPGSRLILKLFSTLALRS